MALRSPLIRRQAPLTMPAAVAAMDTPDDAPPSPGMVNHVGRTNSMVHKMIQRRREAAFAANAPAPQAYETVNPYKRDSAGNIVYGPDGRPVKGDSMQVASTAAAARAAYIGAKNDEADMHAEQAGLGANFFLARRFAEDANTRSNAESGAEVEHKGALTQGVRHDNTLKSGLIPIQLQDATNRVKHEGEMFPITRRLKEADVPHRQAETGAMVSGAKQKGEELDALRKTSGEELRRRDARIRDLETKLQRYQSDPMSSVGGGGDAAAAPLAPTSVMQAETPFSGQADINNARGLSPLLATAPIASTPTLNAMLGNGGATTQPSAPTAVAGAVKVGSKMRNAAGQVIQWDGQSWVPVSQ